MSNCPHHVLGAAFWLTVDGEQVCAECVVEELKELRARAAELEADRDELHTIKEEVVEYVHGGGDFNWIEAVIAIRHWQEEVERLGEVVDELAKALRSVHSWAMPGFPLSESIETLLQKHGLFKAAEAAKGD